MAYIQTKVAITRKKGGNMKYTFSSDLYRSHHEIL